MLRKTFAILGIIAVPVFIILTFAGAALGQDVAPVVAAAPEAAEKLASGGAQIGWSVYELVAGLLGIVLTWLGANAGRWLGGLTKNQTLSRVLTRFGDSVLTAVKQVNQTLRKEVQAAKDPKSPGGSKITKEEAKKLNGAVWDALKAEYGGMDGIKKALGVLGLGEGVESWVNGKIEAAVHDVKIVKKATENPK